MTNWQDPPPPRAGRNPRYVPKELAAEMRAHAGHWVLLDHHTDGAHSAVRGWARRHPDFECTSRTSGEHVDIYVRYVGA